MLGTFLRDDGFLARTPAWQGGREVAGNAGGALKQGEYVSGDRASNAALLTTLIQAAGGTGSVGDGGTLDAILA